MNCLDCPMVDVQRDPDPMDWFNDDDQAAFCLKTPRTKYPDKKKYPSDFVKFRPITVSARPHHLRGECITPKWCPMDLSTD